MYVAITIRHKHANLELIIQDDGIGFRTDMIKKGAGLNNIRNRVYLTSGKLTINSTPGEGCIIEIKLPTKNTKKPE